MSYGGLGSLFFSVKLQRVSKPLALLILFQPSSLLLTRQLPPGPAAGKAHQFLAALSILAGGWQATVPVSIVQVLTGESGGDSGKGLCVVCVCVVGGGGSSGVRLCMKCKRREVLN